jgi:hypothetical protein
MMRSRRGAKSGQIKQITCFEYQTFARRTPNSGKMMVEYSSAKSPGCFRGPVSAETREKVGAGLRDPLEHT